ncbi:MAG: hypothetical protein WKF30_06850 [Pyrinomonadaceae bacterium]
MFIPAEQTGAQQGAATTPDATSRDFFYRPVNAWAADFIPFYAKDKFQLFYLLDWRDVPKHGEGTPWYLISTNDFVNYAEHGEVLRAALRPSKTCLCLPGR